MVIVVGAGISGLSVAWFLHRKGVEVRVLESRDRVGGLIDSHAEDGYLVERGPNSTLHRPRTPDDALGRLVDQAGLSGRLVVAADLAKNRYVMRDGRLLGLPTSPPAMVATRLFSWPAKLRLLGEPFIGKSRDEETIAQFVERRLGREFLDYAVGPFISGVYAGDPRTLSVRAAVPKVHALERDHGSLIRGAIAIGRAAKGAGGPAGRLISFDRGMAVLPKTVASLLPAGTIETRCRVGRLTPGADGWRIGLVGPTGSAEIVTRRLVLAVPAAEAADLVEPVSPEAAGLLRTIPYAPVVSAGLGYAADRVRHPLDGFGFLIPRREGVRTLGGLFSSTLFDGRAPSGMALITAFIGGTTDPRAIDLDDDSLVRRLGGDLAMALGAADPPEMTLLSRHRRAIPQYTLGHLDRVAGIDALAEKLPGLHFRASWRDGISVTDCIRGGEVLAERLSESLK